MIDFAIFEPGVLTTFWAIIACLVAMNSQTNPRPPVVLKSAPFSRMLAVAGALAMSAAYLSYVFVPVARTTAKTQQANQAISVGQFEYARVKLTPSAASLSIAGVRRFTSPA